MPRGRLSGPRVRNSVRLRALHEAPEDEQALTIDTSPEGIYTDDGDGPPRRHSCRYTLTGLPSPGECPECGRGFGLADPATFTTRAPLIGWVFWLPGLLMAGVGGTAAMAVAVYIMGSWGCSLWFGAPAAVGCVVGYRFRAAYVLLPVAILTGVAVFLLGVVPLRLGGVFCALMLSLIVFGPIAGATVIGALLRLWLKGTRFGQRRHLPAIGMLLVCVALAAVEGPPPRRAPGSISGERVIAASPDAVWAAIQFYEEVTHGPPPLLRVGLARPLYTTGASAAPGDVKVCISNKGRIAKRITRADAPALPAFDVIERRIGYERDAGLIGGRFELAPAGAAATRVRLTTTYEPLLTPRWCWRPAERLAVGMLHGHVLEGMAMQAEAARPRAGR